MLLWRVFYGGSVTYSSADGSPYDTPRLNVQAIVGADPQSGRYLVSDKDAYWWEPRLERWFGGDRRGEWDYLCRLGPRVVLYGRAVSEADYNSCIAAALADPDFSPKTARGRGERMSG